MKCGHHRKFGLPGSGLGIVKTRYLVVRQRSVLSLPFQSPPRARPRAGHCYVRREALRLIMYYTVGPQLPVKMVVYPSIHPSLASESGK